MRKPIPVSPSLKLYYLAITLLSLFWSIFIPLDLLGVINASVPLRAAGVVIIIIFVIDYCVRLYLAEDKRKFFRRNRFELLSIIPFFAMFRIIKVLRSFGYWRAINRETTSFLIANGFGYALLVTLGFVFMGATALYYAERGHTVTNYFEAVYVSVITATTVGYGDFAPVTTLGRTVCIVISLIGVVWLGILAGTMSSFFMNRAHEIRQSASNTRKAIEGVEESLFGDSVYITDDMLDLSIFSDMDAQKIISYAEFLRSTEE